MRLVDIDDERFWNILFDEACVEGNQARRIENALNEIRAYDVDKVVKRMITEFKKYYGENWDKAPYLVIAIEIVKRGGIE